jgi:hypothetical protein
MRHGGNLTVSRSPGLAAGAVIAATRRMRSVMVLVLALLVPGCKGMGGLGHVLGGLGHVAAASGRVLAPMAKVIGHAVPITARVANAALNTAIAVSQMNEVEVVSPAEEVVVYAPAGGGPLIDDGDACGYCPDNLECGACGDVNQVACVSAPPGTYTRCESSLKLHPPGW